jgi:transposase
MILKAREVRLRPEDRAVLGLGAGATTPQRDVRRARIILLAAEGASTRSIRGRLASKRPSSARGGTALHMRAWKGLRTASGRASLRRNTAETDRRILAVLDGPVPEGYARWTAPLIAERLGDVHEQRIWRVLRKHKIDLAGAILVREQ